MFSQCFRDWAAPSKGAIKIHCSIVAKGGIPAACRGAPGGHLDQNGIGDQERLEDATHYYIALLCTMNSKLSKL